MNRQRTSWLSLRDCKVFFVRTIDSPEYAFRGMRFERNEHRAKVFPEPTY